MSNINDVLNRKYKEFIKTLLVEEFPRYIYLNNIVLKNKGQGTGSKVLSDILDYANEKDKPVSLYPIAHKDSRKRKINKENQRRLENFYKRLGFEEKENSFQGTMVYFPNKEER